MRGIALSGGGARGLAHVGVLETLSRAGYDFDVIAGTSMGAIVGALFASGHSPEEMLKIIASHPWRRLFRFRFWRRPLPAARLVELLRPYLPATFAELERPLAVVAVDLVRGRPAYLSQGPLPEAVAASAAHPLLFLPLRMGERVLADGGVVDNLPVDAARFLGAAEVVAVDVSAELDGTLGRGAMAAALRSVEVMQATVNQARLALFPPDVYLRPAVGGFQVEDFQYAPVIVEAGREAAEDWLRLER